MPPVNSMMPSQLPSMNVYRNNSTASMMNSHDILAMQAGQIYPPSPNSTGSSQKSPEQKYSILPPASSIVTSAVLMTAASPAPILGTYTHLMNNAGASPQLSASSASIISATNSSGEGDYCSPGGGGDYHHHRSTASANPIGYHIPTPDDYCMGTYPPMNPT